LFATFIKILVSLTHLACIIGLMVQVFTLGVVNVFIGIFHGGAPLWGG